MAVAKTPTSTIQDQANQLGLTVVVLTNALVETAPTDVLPLPIVEARRIFPYQLDSATQTLSVAVADPSQLKQAAPVELQAQRKLGRRLKLELVDPATFDQLLPAIRKRLSKPQTANRKPLTGTHESAILDDRSSSSPLAARRWPMVDLSTIQIPRSVFLKIPHDVATKFRIIAFAAPSATKVKLATDRPGDEGVQRVVAVIRAKRGVAVELYEAAGSQLDDLIDAYVSSADPISLVAPSVDKKIPVTSDQNTVNKQPRPPSVTPAPQPTVRAGAPVGPTAHLPFAPPATPIAPPVSTRSAVSPPPMQPAVSIPPPVTPATVAPTATIAATKPVQDRSPVSVHAAPSADTLPVDTSPVTTPVPTTGSGKIRLASPLPNFANPAPTTRPLPTEVTSQLAAAPAASATPLAGALRSPLPGLSGTPPSSPAAPAILSLPTPGAALNLVQPASPSGTTGGPLGPGAAPPATPVVSTLGPAVTEDQNLDTTVGSTIRSPAELEAVVKTGLVPKLLAAILQYAVNTGASDIHVEAEAGDLRIRFRIDGQLQDILKAPIGLHAPLVSRLKILAKMKIDEQRVPQDGRFSATTANRQIDFRVSTLPAIHGEKVVLRILDKSTSLKAIDQLGIDGINGQRVTLALQKPFGIILVTGPTGSGKTTTLYAMLSQLNKPGVNIVTLEDPVEYELPGITQTQVKPKIGFGFAEGLRSILRQDPDVIMVGEIRDRETASLATHAALTGHLVLSTLHTNNAAGAIPRFLDMGVEPFLIASSMEAVIGQRLVRKLCEACRAPAQLSAAIQQDLQAELTRATVPDVKALANRPLQLFAPKGCDQCHDGYKGRLGIYEVMVVTPEIETLTATKAPLTEIEALAVAQGMVTMKQDGIAKALKGLTSIDEILRVTTSD